MLEAIREAEKSLASGDVPVGAVIVKDGEIISRAYNMREAGLSATAHAEICAVEQACKKLKTRRLSGCEMYVTLEPCPMCAGAIINARLPRVVYGAKEPTNGCCGSAVDLFMLPCSQKPEVVPGVLEEECSAMLSAFFRRLREKRKKE